MQSASGTPGTGYPETSTLPPPAPPPSSTQRSLPIGVAILSILIGIYGFFVFLTGLLLLVNIGIPSYFGHPPSFGLAGVELAAIVTIIGLVILGIAVALWRLRLWALVLAILFLLYELISYAYAGHYESIGFVVALLLFLYLLAVNRHFR